MALTVEVKNDTVDAGNEGKLVLVSGKAETDAKLEDSIFGVEVPANP